MTPDDPRRDLYIRWHPGYAFGEPTICTSAIKAESVASLIWAGDSVEEVAEDYGLTVDQVRRWEVVPPMTPAAVAIDWTDLGQRIGDRVKPLAPSTMDRVRRCIAKFAEFPAVLMPAKGAHGVERLPHQPASTQTSQQETALLTSGALAVVAGNSYERPGSDCRIRGPHEQLWTGTAATTRPATTPGICSRGRTPTTCAIR